MKGPFGQPERHQGGTREAGKDLLDSLGHPARKNFTDPFGSQTLGFRVLKYTSINYKRRLRYAPFMQGYKCGTEHKANSLCSPCQAPSSQFFSMPGTQRAGSARDVQSS